MRAKKTHKIQKNNTKQNKTINCLSEAGDSRKDWPEASKDDVAGAPRHHSPRSNFACPASLAGLSQIQPPAHHNGSGTVSCEGRRIREELPCRDPK